MIKYINRLKDSEYFKNLTVLASGTAGAQLIPILVSPILTRLYSPDAFGAVAIYMAIAGVIASSVTGRYDTAIVLPKSDKNALHLLGVSVFFSIFLSSLIFVIIKWFYDEIQTLINIDNWGLLIYLVPFSTLVTGFNLSGSYFQNRVKSYSKLAYAKLIRAVIFVVISLSIGVISAEFWGLIVGEILGLTAATIYLFKGLLFRKRHYIFNFSYYKIILLKRYKEFPIYSATTAVLDGINEHIPVFFISYFYGNNIVGFYSIFIRVFSAPLSFLAIAISQINAKKVVEIIQEGTDLPTYLYSLTGILLTIAAIPTVILIMFGPTLFGFVLGEQWIEAGEYAQILSIAFMVRFAVSTVSTTLDSTNNPRYVMYWRIPAFILTLSVYLIFAGTVDIKTLLYIAVAAHIISYSLYFYVISMAAQRPKV